MSEMIIAVDFDGTLCENMWPGIGAPNVELIDILIEARKMGHKVILWTCRTANVLYEAIEFCRAEGLEFDAVNENLPKIINRMGGDSRKIFADMYIDDKAYDPWNVSSIACTLLG